MRARFLRLYGALATALLVVFLSTWTYDWLALRPAPEDPQLWVEAEAAVRTAYAAHDEAEAERQVQARYRLRVRVLDGPVTPRPPRPGPWPPPPTRDVTLDDGRRVRLTWDRPPPPLGLPALGLGGLVAAAAALLWWLRGLDASLHQLVAAARRFGGGDLDARVPPDPSRPTHELDAAFNQMAERIQDLVRAQEDLLAGVSHELRTPLTRLRFAVELLGEVEEPADRARRIEDLHGDLAELDALIGELLSFARLRGGDRIEPTALDVDALLGEVAEETRRLAPDREVEVRPSPWTVHADRRLVLRALRNLATNAVRHGAGRITLAAEPTGEGLALVVGDEGPGIPEASRDHVLQPFVRLDAARGEGGLGLGLALVDRIARLHRGRVEVGDAPGGGARVAVVLPGPTGRGASTV